PVLDHLVLGEVRDHRALIRQHIEAGAEYLTGAGRKAADFLAVGVEEDTVAPIGEQDRPATEKRAGRDEVAHGSAVGKDLLTVAVQFRQAVAMDDKSVPVRQAVGGEDGPVQFPGPEYLAPCAPFADALTPVLGNQDAVASERLG